MPLALEWRAPPPCPSTEQLTNDVARTLSGAAGVRRPVAARVAVEQVEARVWRVDMNVEAAGAARQRSFDAESCEAAAEAVTLILAIAMNPLLSPSPAATAGSSSVTGSQPADGTNAVVGAGDTTPAGSGRGDGTSGTPFRESVARETRPAVPLPRGEPARGASRAFGIAASFAADTSILPNAALGGDVAIGWQHRTLRVELAAAYWWPQETRDASSSAGADFHALSGELRGTYGWPAGAITAGPVLGVGLEGVKASGFGGNRANFDRSAIIPEIAAGGFLAWPAFEPFVLQFSAEMAVPLSRPSFVVLEPPPVSPYVIHRPPSLAGRAMFGARVSIF
jgi:hypothetical protein